GSSPCLSDRAPVRLRRHSLHFSDRSIFHTPGPAAFSAGFASATIPPLAAAEELTRRVHRPATKSPDSAPLPAFPDRAASHVRIRFALLCFSAVPCTRRPTENVHTQNHPIPQSTSAVAQLPPEKPVCRYRGVPRPTNHSADSPLSASFLFRPAPPERLAHASAAQ